MIGERCPVCGSEAKVVERERCVILVSCESCHSETYVRMHPAVDRNNSILLTAKAYKACVDVDDPALILKTRIRVKKVFGGYDNFRIDRLEQQISCGDKCWDLGVYSEDEIEVLQKKAEEVGLKVLFLARQWNDNGGFSFPRTESGLRKED